MRHQRFSATPQPGLNVDTASFPGTLVQVKICLLAFALIGSSTLFAESNNTASTEPDGQEQWLAALEALRKEVPEFALFYDAISTSELKSYQFDKKRRRPTTSVLAPIGGRYVVSLNYTIDYKPGFAEIEKIAEEHLGFTRNTDVGKLRPNQALRPFRLVRSDLKKIVDEGEAYLAKLVTSRSGN